MKTLFRLPLPFPQRIEPTIAQMQILDLVALHEGEPLDAPLRKYRFTRQVLRRVLEAKLVTCVALGPARYMLTPVGRLVRGRNGRQKGRNTHRAGLE